MYYGRKRAPKVRDAKGQFVGDFWNESKKWNGSLVIGLRTRTEKKNGDAEWIQHSKKEWEKRKGQIRPNVCFFRSLNS